MAAVLPLILKHMELNDRLNPFSAAWNLAALYHQHQAYGALQLPYLTHIGDVMLQTICLVYDEGDTRLAIHCAILHDLLEDSSASYGLILELFGEAVANGVLALTKDGKLKTKSAQLNDSIDRILMQPVEVAIVKMADRICNLRQSPPGAWSQKKIDSYINQSLILHRRLAVQDQRAGDCLFEAIEAYTNIHGGSNA
jgi:guanosine-3',5'-bis(diphosphate) 3'-pyrophosphohydrolase